MTGTEIRKITQHKESIRITIPSNISWNAGDNIKFEKIDENTVKMIRIV